MDCENIVIFFDRYHLHQLLPQGMIYFFGGGAQVFRFYAWQRGHVHFIREVSLKIPEKNSRWNFFSAPHTVVSSDPGPGTRDTATPDWKKKTLQKKSPDILRDTRYLSPQVYRFTKWCIGASCFVTQKLMFPSFFRLLDNLNDVLYQRKRLLEKKTLQEYQVLVLIHS